MKKALAVVLATIFVGVFTGGALAQVPFIQAYFDADYNETQSDCKAPTTISSLYVAALNLNTLVVAIDYKILLPPALLYDSEAVNVLPTELYIGASNIGIGIAYGLPRNGFVTMLLSRVFVEWTGLCDCEAAPQGVRVVGYDDVFSPVPKMVDFGGNEHLVVGMLSLVCPGQVSTETTTWGGVKALYR
jgi:hypothetical protein